MAGIRPIVITGPSGTGKSTIFNRVMAEFPDTFAFSVSHTTRNIRPGEIDGTHYHFVTKDVMQKMIEEGEFVEHATFGNNTYGTSKKAIKEIEATGKICVLDLELQGVRNMKKLNYPAKYILIRAPSLQILQERLTARGTETPETIAQRLQHAQEDDEAAQSEPHLFDKVIVNDVLEKAHQEFVDAIGDELEAFKALRAKLANGKSNSSS